MLQVGSCVQCCQHTHTQFWAIFLCICHVSDLFISVAHFVQLLTKFWNCFTFLSILYLYTHLLFHITYVALWNFLHIDCLIGVYCLNRPFCIPYSCVLNTASLRVWSYSRISDSFVVRSNPSVISSVAHFVFVYIWRLEENVVLILSNLSCIFKLLIYDNAFVQFKCIMFASFDNLLRIGSFRLCVATFCFTLHRWCLMLMHLLPGKNFVYERPFSASAVCISRFWAFVCDFWRFMVCFAYPFTVAPTSHYHGVWGYFVPFLSSESSVSEPPISASAFGYLGMLHVYELIPSVYGLFGSVRMYVCIASLVFELLVFASAFYCGLTCVMFVCRIWQFTDCVALGMCVPTDPIFHYVLGVEGSVVRSLLNRNWLFEPLYMVIHFEACVVYSPDFTVLLCVWLRSSCPSWQTHFTFRIQVNGVFTFSANLVYYVGTSFLVNHMF